MIEKFSFFIVFIFGIFFIFVGILMLLKPEKAREILRKAGSTNFINYSEITVRIIPGLGLILYSENSKFPLIFNIFGWFMLATSIVLYCIPRKLHHQFSLKSAEFLKPIYFQIIAPFSIIIGLFLLYCIK